MCELTPCSFLKNYGLVESGYLTVLDEWEVPRDQLSITSTSLGSGQFGIVKKATFHTRDEHGEDTDLLVAVKFLKGKSIYGIGFNAKIIIAFCNIFEPLVYLKFIVVELNSST